LLSESTRYHNLVLTTPLVWCQYHVGPSKN